MNGLPVPKKQERPFFTVFFSNKKRIQQHFGLKSVAEPQSNERSACKYYDFVTFTY